MVDTIFRPLADLRAEYWMIQKLGCGGFGKVYLIRNRQSRHYCAAKHQKWLTPDTQRNARREVSILRRLEHQNHIVLFKDYFEGEEQSVILTEYLQGGELFQRISSKDYQLTEAKCRDFFRQILRGVDFIHSKKILHLDLKPQNIVLANPISQSVLDEGDGLSESRRSLSASMPGNDRLKIIDFGLARELGLYADRIPITMCGTLEFMAPEVMRCSHASTGSDMWSAGVILYMMLSGGLSPFWAGSEYRTQRRVIRGIYNLEHPNFKDISKAAMDCIEKLLDTDGGRRLSAAQCLEHQWLTGSYLDTLKQLETTWMRKYLAKRRWQRWFNTVKAMNRMKHLASAGGEETDFGLSPYSTSSSVNREQPQQDKERWV